MAAGHVAEALELAPNTLTFHFDRLRDARAGHRAPRRPLDDLRGALRDHERSARLPDRELLPGRGAGVRAGSSLQTGARQARQSLRHEESPMKRMHVHVAVDDLQQSIGFYSALFAARAVGHQDRLRQVDARRSARQFRHLDARPAGRPRSSRHSGRERRRTERDLRAAAQRRRQHHRARPDELAATPSRKNPGSTIRPASRGKRSTPPAKAPITATAAASASRALRMRSRAARRSARRARAACGCSAA